MSWKTETFGNLLTESKIPSPNPDTDKRIRVRLNVKGVEKRPDTNDKKGATKQYIRKAGQFIYGKQNFHKGAFGIIPPELDNYETSSDIPSFDVREDCLPEWIYYYFKAGNRYLELVKYARGVGSKRIHPKQIVDIEIPLPPIQVQKDIIEEIRRIEKDELSQQLSLQLNLVTQLRQAFLREAMQGKLTEDWRAAHPELIEGENSASALLERIKAEKEQLIREKKIKKQKPLPPITDDEIPFEIPEGWVWCRLNDICDAIIDCPHSTPKYIDSETDFYGIDTNCINDKGEIIRLRGLSEKSYLDRIKRLTPRTNDIVYSREGSIGLAAFIPPQKNICLGQRVMLFRPSTEMLPEFLKYVVTEEEYKNRLIAKHRGIGAKHVNVRDIVASTVPVPSKSEQSKIISKLDALMLHCDSLDESIRSSQAQNEMLLGQVLKEALGDNHY